jgi:hypothetical protein
MRFRFLSFLFSFLVASLTLLDFPIPVLAKDDEGITYYCSLTKENLADCANCYLDDEKHATADADAEECIDRSWLGKSHLGYDLVACFIWFVGAGLAVSAGVGGGGIYVPLGEDLIFGGNLLFI